MTIDDEREEAHAQLAKERWSAHRELHAGEKELEALRWDGHDQHHDSIARSLSEYKEQSNEWRGSLSDLRATFASLDALQAIEREMRAGLSELSRAIATEREERREQQNLRAGQRQGISQTTAVILGSLTAGATLIGIAGVLYGLLSGGPP